MSVDVQLNLKALRVYNWFVMEDFQIGTDIQVVVYQCRRNKLVVSCSSQIVRVGAAQFHNEENLGKQSFMPYLENIAESLKSRFSTMVKPKVVPESSGPRFGTQIFNRCAACSADKLK